MSNYLLETKVFKKKYLILSFITFSSFTLIINFYPNFKIYLSTYILKIYSFTSNLPTQDSSFFSKSFYLIFLFIALISPTISALIIEMLYTNGSFIKRLSSTSFAKINEIKLNKYADIYYFFFGFIINKLSAITILFPFGISLFNNTIFSKISSITESFYSNYLLINNSFLLCILMILIRDFCAFGTHWLQHNNPLLWDWHELHHSATQMTLLNEQRIALYEQIFNKILFIPINTLLGLIMAKALKEGEIIIFVILITYLIGNELVGILSHGSTKIVFPKPISFIFLSPSLHWIHHSEDPKHFGKNLGAIFTFWDIIFGSYLSENHIEEVKAFGIKETIYNKSHPIISYAFTPLYKTLVTLKKGFIL